MTSPPTIGAIVVGYDASPAASRAFALALVLARSTHARLFLLNVREAEPDRAEPTTEEESTSVETAIAASVAAWAARAAEEGVAFTAVTRERPTSVAIVNLAEEVGAGLIVVGTRGLRPVAKAVFGSVSSDVVARAHVPVLVVP